MIPDKTKSDLNLDAVVAELRGGNVIACATDTVYGLLADPVNPEAVQRIFTLKGRAEKKPLQILAISVDVARELIEIPKKFARLLEYWPGGLTLVGARKMTTAAGVGTSRTLGVRVPTGNTIRKLLLQFGGSLGATSANPSGQPSATQAKQVRAYFGDTLRILGADAEVTEAQGSTVIDITGQNIRVLRQGAVLVTPQA